MRNSIHQFFPSFTEILLRSTFVEDSVYSPIVHTHNVTAVESKEKLAEVWFREHFRAADAMLWEARLSPAFWVDAVSPSQYLANRTPNGHTGGVITPHQMLTGERARWDKLRVFWV